MSIGSLFSTISLLTKLPHLFFSRRCPQTINNEQDKQVGSLDSPISTLPPELILKIFEFLPLQGLARITRVCKEWSQIGSEQSLWKSLLNRDPAIRNLDNANLKSIGFPQVKGPTADPRELLKAAKIACKASENGCSTILTIPAGWSWDDLEKISQNAVAAGIPSARIDILDEYKDLLRKTPIKEEQTIVLTDTVIKDSRNKSVNKQKSSLKAAGFEEKLPDALTVLTIAVLTRIISPSFPLS
jgi:hypothetical protein